MSLQSELENLNNAVQRMKREVRRALLRQLGVDKLVRRAFEEGWSRRGEIDPSRCIEIMTVPKQAQRVMDRTCVWRSVDEAWANSDVEEEV